MGSHNKPIRQALEEVNRDVRNALSQVDADAAAALAKLLANPSMAELIKNLAKSL